MKYASQINVVILVVALVTVGYAVSQTVWKSPVTPSFDLGGLGLTGASSRQESEAPESAEAELSGRENLRRQSQSPRAAPFQPNREPQGGSRANLQPTTASPRRVQPAGVYPEDGDSAERGPRVITTGPGFPPEGRDPIQDRSQSMADMISRTIEKRRETGVSGSSNRAGQRPAGSTLPPNQTRPPAGGARRNTQPPPPPYRSSNR